MLIIYMDASFRLFSRSLSDLLLRPFPACPLTDWFELARRWQHRPVWERR